MAHLFAPKIPDPELPVMFNVDGVVGANPAQNLREDVLLVQFAFEILGKEPLPTTPPEVLAAAKAVRPTGMIDKATINAIFVLQGALGNPATVVDGRVSPVKGGYSYGSAMWTIVHLNNFMQNRHVDVWPRIDKIQGCPSELKQMVIRTVAGV
jgi:hypothetical protein